MGKALVDATSIVLGVVIVLGLLGIVLFALEGDLQMVFISFASTLTVMWMASLLVLLERLCNKSN